MNPSSSAALGPRTESTSATERLLAERLDNVEIKLSYVEDLLDSLNTLVARQAEQIEVLGRELLRAKERLEQAASARPGEPGNDPAAERPPHY